MNKLISYIKESTDELLHKVSWPTWSELQSSAMLVAVAAFIIAIIVYAMDATFGGLIRMFYNMFV